MADELSEEPLFLLTDPHELFARWFAEAVAAEPDVPDAFQLATQSPEGPDVRTLLLKEHGRDGWVFYTNLGSAKCAQLAAEPRVSAQIHWKSLARQVRAHGRASLLHDDVADAYFATRPRGSQIGAWASRQSQSLPSRQVLRDRVAEVTARFEGREVPRPPGWSGYRIDVTRFEFWQGRPSRLHDRVVFERMADGWTRGMLYP